MSAPTQSAPWLPPALREAPPEEPGAPRLIDDLLAAVDRQRDLLAADVDSVWDDFFIESCAEWAVPYIAALVGLPEDAGRREVAYAIALRRRKGTPAALEAFAEVLSGWTVRVIEGWQVVAWSQRLGHPPPPRVCSVDLRDGSEHRIGSPFERTRRSFSPGGRWSPRAASAVVWPWEVRSYVAVEAAALPEPRRFALHPLGADAPLYLRPAPRRLTSDAAAADEDRTGDELDAPVRVTYKVVEALAATGQITYGENLTLAAEHPLAAPGVLVSLDAAGAEVPAGAVRLGSLPPGGAAPGPPAHDEVVVDVARGQVELGADFEAPLRASWHRPVPGALGALASEADADPAARVVVVVDPTLPVAGRHTQTLEQAIDAAEALSAGLDPGDSQPGRPDVEIRLETSDRLQAPPPISFAPTLPRWRLVAPRLRTPTVVGDLELDLEGACLALEGFALDGDLVLGASLDGVDVAHLTMNPPAGAELRVDPKAWGLSLAVERSILGAVRADLGALPIDLRDSIVDGRGARLRPCGGDRGGGEKDAVAGNGGFHPALRAAGVTFAGAVRLESAEASDCIFIDGVEVVQQQVGCLSHCYLGPDLTSPPSRPPSHACGPFPEPSFASVGFEAAGYYAPMLEPDHPLLSAAADGGEIGAYRHARRAARFRRLGQRLHEFVPLGLRPGLTLAPWEE
jgi:hypothetical protein